MDEVGDVETVQTQLVLERQVVCWSDVGYSTGPRALSLE